MGLPWAWGKKKFCLQFLDSPLKWWRADAVALVIYINGFVLNTNRTPKRLTLENWVFSEKRQGLLSAPPSKLGMQEDSRNPVSVCRGSLWGSLSSQQGNLLSFMTSRNNVLNLKTLPSTGLCSLSCILEETNLLLDRVVSCKKYFHTNNSLINVFSRLLFKGFVYILKACNLCEIFFF